MGPECEAAYFPIGMILLDLILNHSPNLTFWTHLNLATRGNSNALSFLADHSALKHYSDFDEVETESLWDLKLFEGRPLRRPQDPSREQFNHVLLISEHG